MNGSPVIGFAGLSHLGIVSSVAAAAKGFEVIAYDSDAVVCEQLRAAQPPVVEPELNDLMSRHAERLVFDSSANALESCEVVFLTLDVPVDVDGHSDLTAVCQLFEQVVQHVAQDTTIVLLSQIPPGFTRSLVSSTGTFDISSDRLFCQVETLIFGRAVERALHPERFIIGCASAETALPDAYTKFLGSFDCPILPMRYESSELAKIAVNMFLVSSVTTTNTLAEVCEAVGAEWAEVVPALRLDARIGSKAYLNPGLGIGGTNLLRDLVTIRGLAAEYDTHAEIVDTWLEDSAYRRDWVCRLLEPELASRDDGLVAVWGLAYKVGTGSTKHSPGCALIESLGEVKVRAYDPKVSLGDVAPANMFEASSSFEAVRGADVLAVMTPWPEFQVAELETVMNVMRGRLILDPYGVLNGQRCRRLGFVYRRLGTPAASASEVHAASV
jgi:UDPglucose 6-dehydrogenase